MQYAELGYAQLTLVSNVTPAAALELGITNSTDPTLMMKYTWTGNPKDYFYDSKMQFDFLAFGIWDFAVNLIHLSGYPGMPDSSNQSIAERTIPTNWGDLLPIYENITIPYSYAGDAYGTDSYALQCVLLRQEGLLEYRRRKDRSWFIASSSFHDERKVVRSFLEDSQFKLSAGRPAPPLGDVLWGGATTVDVCNEELSRHCFHYIDFTTAVNNLVFASGEATRIIYNVAALNSSRDRVEYFYNVTGDVDRQFYRITYVPVLLLVALLGIIICALLITVLVVATMKTWSWKIFRQVDITRLVVDCVGADLGNNNSTFSQMVRASDDELEEWAGRYRVIYERVADTLDMKGCGQRSVRLRHTTSSGVEGSGSYETIHSLEQSD